MKSHQVLPIEVQRLWARKARIYFQLYEKQKEKKIERAIGKGSYLVLVFCNKVTSLILSGLIVLACPLKRYLR